MDKIVRVNFYKVSVNNRNDVHLFDSLTQLDEMVDKDGYVQLSHGINVRLERLLNAGGFLKGEVVRQQTENLPPIAHENVPLEPNMHPLGHRSAFQYYPRLEIIAIEANRQGVSTGRFNQFIRRRLPRHKGFFFDPCLNTEALAQLRDGTPRQLSLRVARPSDLNQLVGDPHNIEQSLSSLQEMVSGNMVTVEVGFSRGNRNSRLNLGSITEILRWATGNRGSVKKLTVKTLEDDIPIDLFGQQIFERQTLDIDSNDVEGAYHTRSTFLQDSFAKRMDELEDLYGGNEN